MADKPIDQITSDEKLAQAKELLSIATRNYYVKEYSDAVDDLSTVCSVYSDVYGPTADELGMPYLLYAKCLVALGQDENKIMDIPEEEEDDDDGEDEDEAAATPGTDGDDKEEEEEKEKGDGDKEEVDDKEKGEGDSKESEKNGEEKEAEAEKTPIEPQPGTSTGIMASDGDEVKEDEEDDVANLQLAWEVLELAVTIFSRNDEKAKQLAECYSELAGISFENSNFELAIKDYNKALDIIQDLPERNNREFAEIHYKIGLSFTMLNQFEDAKVALQKACEHLDEVIRIEEAKPQSEETINVISDLKETKQEIINKIAEVEDYKQQSLEEVKKELSKLVGNNDSFDGAGPSSATGESPSSKPAADISHLIKRKRPDESPSAATVSKSEQEPPNDISNLIKRKK